MTDITQLAQRVRHWSEMAALTSERVSCLGVEQLEEIASVLESRTVTVRLPEYRNSPDMHTKQYYEAIGFNQGLDGCVEALTAAGIQVIEGEQKNG